MLTCNRFSCRRSQHVVRGMARTSLQTGFELRLVTWAEMALSMASSPPHTPSRPPQCQCCDGAAKSATIVHRVWCVGNRTSGHGAATPPERKAKLEELLATRPLAPLGASHGIYLSHNRRYTTSLHSQSSDHYTSLIRVPRALFCLNSRLFPFSEMRR